MFVLMSINKKEWITGTFVINKKSNEDDWLLSVKIPRSTENLIINQEPFFHQKKTKKKQINLVSTHYCYFLF